MRFSVIIPFDFHRDHALACVRGWVLTQGLPGHEFELVCILPRRDPDRLREQIEALLRPHDRVILSDQTHDMTLCAEGAVHARGDFLFFTESHVWPEEDVLRSSEAIFEEHPDWAAFSCRTTRVARTRLAQVEADFYERDINYAMKTNPWRKILDQCFVTRRPAYVDAGGFDPQLGHFAEWELAARYFDRGLKIGFAPQVTLRHYYCGDAAELREFTHSFAEGEIRFFARERESNSVIETEAPPEWSQRGNWDRRLARALVTSLRKYVFAPPISTEKFGLWREILHWLLVACGGIQGWRVMALLKSTWCRAQLSLIELAGSQSRLAGAFEDFIRSVIHAGRLTGLARCLVALDVVPPRTGDMTADDVRHESRMAGFHLREVGRSVALRWSEPAAVIELTVPPGSGGIAVQCAPVRHPMANLPLTFFINETPVPRTRIAFSDHRAVLSLDHVTSGLVRLAWVCQPFATVGDARRLGLPIVKISVYGGDWVLPGQTESNIFFKDVTTRD